MRVLLVRARQDGQASAALLQDLGHEAILAPLLETRATAFVPPQAAFDGLIATSAQAFLGSFPQNWRAWPLHVVGARTAAAARAAGFRDIAFVASNAAELAAAILQSPPQNLLYLAGVARKSELESRLAAAGRPIQALEVYRADEVKNLPENARAALADHGIDAALHYSRRSAEIFCARVIEADLQSAAAGLVHIALSPDVAQPLRTRRWKVFVASEPKQEKMFALLQQTLLTPPPH